MLHLVYVVAGAAAGIHAYTYGRWLKQQGNIPGAIFSFSVAAAAATMPVLHLILK